MHWTPEGNTDHQVTCRIVSTVRFAEEACAVLLSVKFEPCHYVVNPEPYVKNCRYDVCSCADGQECLCDCCSQLCSRLCSQGSASQLEGTWICGISHSVCLNAIYNIFFLSIFILFYLIFQYKCIIILKLRYIYFENRRWYDLFSENIFNIFWLQQEKNICQCGKIYFLIITWIFFL